MATKNLARTVIEGGRCEHYKREAVHRIRSERATVRTFLRDATVDQEAVDDTPTPMRRPLKPCFADKIHPIESFLESRVGRSWDKTFAVICERFDRRTTPGRHVTNDHLLNQIALHGEHELEQQHWNRFYRYFVDRFGILRKVPSKPRRRWRPDPPSVTVEQIIVWLNGRKVGRMGARYVWFVPSRDAETVRIVSPQVLMYGRWTPSNHILYVEVDTFGNVVWDERSCEVETRRLEREMRPSRVPYVQASVLSESDAAFLDALPDHLRGRVLQHAPRNPHHRVFRS